MSNIWLDIDDLVLDGPGDGVADASALSERTEAALHRMLDQRGIPSPSGDGRTGSISRLAVQLRGESRSGPVADTIAAAVYRTLGQVK